MTPIEIIERALRLVDTFSVKEQVRRVHRDLHAAGYRIVHDDTLYSVLVLHHTTTYTDPWTVRCGCGQEFHDDVHDPEDGTRLRGAFGKWANHVHQLLAEVGGAS
ncbi:hypothetical protein SEA_REYNAULD_3 [Rhodococcus phage Reynauld]|uniref:Uncharacterized protein n=1 Tax=Rhodococcus phage Reynauld TaxID=3062845 RepID=A0ACD4UJE9_9CAUD|nr:hypothetical protein SEA_REYNAULD_3 [Rhodococcus phage Reynauld]